MRADLKRLRRDTDAGRISGRAAVQGIFTESDARSAVQPSVMGLRRKQFDILAACVALLVAAFAAYHFWPSKQNLGDLISFWFFKSHRDVLFK
jgi:hypothetical protein